MEVSNNIQPKVISVGQINNNNAKHANPSFGNIVVTTMDAIERGGFAAAFVVQDTMGMTTPRTIAGLVRNRDITGEYNKQEALEVFIREFVSGSAMVLVPMVMLWGIKGKFGTANDVPVKMIQMLGKQFEKTVNAHGIEKLTTDPAAMRKLFYTDVFKNILTNAYDKGVSAEVIDQKAADFAERLIKAESAPKKSFFKVLSGARVENSSNDILGDLAEEFAEIRKKGTINASSYFTQAKINNGEVASVEKDFAKAITDIRNFTEDILKTAKKKLGGADVDSSKVLDFVKRFTDFRSGSRVLVNASMLGGLIAFCSCIPKLYQLSDKNPGLDGLPGNEKGSKAESDNKPQSGKNVSFCGAERAVSGLGRTVAKDGSIWSKISGAFEFDGFNTSMMTFLTACTFGIIGPRLKNAREENEYKEVLFRDTTTVGTVMFAAKALQNIFSQVCTKASGFALNKKNEAGKSFAARMFDYLRPAKGVHVLGSSELTSHYANIQNYQDGVVGFMRFVNEQGGNLRKMFASNKQASELVETIYKLGSNGDYNKATNEQIIDAFRAAKDVSGADKKLEELAQFFKNDKTNTFLKKAKFLNSSFNFVTLFAVVPILLGWVIPRFNEAMTKKREFEKHNAANDGPQQAVATAKTLPLTAENIKLTETFKQFVAKKD